MTSLNLASVRQLYLDFMASQGHAIVPSVNLVPENDPTTLFTSAGMQPMIPYFFGAAHPEGKRIANSQKCFRSEDIEEVGDNRHTTFFEMLGNWSFGDYFKKEQITFFFKFLVEALKLDPERLYISVFAGDEELGIPRDDEAAETWQALFEAKGVEAKIIANPEEGLQGGRIFFYGEKKNWWSRSGLPSKMPVGEPGGPDSEVFYDFAEDLNSDQEEIHQQSTFAAEPCHINCDCGRFLEVGNSVFMQYQRNEEGFVPLAQTNIDFGGGLGRFLAAALHQPDVFQTPAFSSIIAKISQLGGQSYEDMDKRAAFRIVADHIRASVMLIADGVLPSNKEQGYLLRRLIRRALRQARYLNIEQEFLAQLVPVVIALYEDFYPELKTKAAEIAEVLLAEERKFNRTLAKGLQEFNRLLAGRDLLTADLAFKLYESYGFPFELSIEEAQARQLQLEEDIENKIAVKRQAHAKLSRQGAADKFKGGLADQSERTTAFHTTTHLLQAALRQVLGDSVAQKGSNITADRLRFDFVHDQALSEAELKAVEKLINQWLAEDLVVSQETMSKDMALKSGAIAFFAERYPDTVTVYTIGDAKHWISKELCGGPHVENLAMIAQFGQIEIFKEKAVSAGVRRIYARFKTD